MNNISVLLIEDTTRIASEICNYLANQGMRVDYAATGHLGMQLVSEHEYDVIVMDWMLPDADGVELCKRIKHQCDPEPPVIMLTARDSIADKMQGFDAGADDYLTKPFDLIELSLRCQALARRQQLHQSQAIHIGELYINEKQKTVQRNGRAIKLSNKDFEILLMLVHAYPNAVSRQQIINKIWGDDTPDSDVLRSHMYTLRRAVDKPFTYPMISTLHGIGFRLEAKNNEVNPS